MKKLKLLLAVCLVAPMMGSAQVFAETTASVQTSASAGTTTSTTPTTTPTGASSDDATARQKRIAENIAKLKTTLTAAAKARVVLKCKAAQAVVAARGTDVSAGAQVRLTAYKNMTDTIQKLLDRLKANGKDTTEAQADLKVAEQKIADISTGLTTYEQTMADLKALDCTADPAGFQATLDTARAQREDLRKAADDLHTYLKDTLKPALIKLRPAESTSTTTHTTTTTNAAGTNAATNTSTTSKTSTTGGNQ